MKESSDAWFEVDWQAFDPWRILPVRHRLAQHPLFQLPALIALGERLEAAGRVRSHSDTAAAGTSFNDAPRLHPNQKSAAATLADLEHAGAWTSLLNVQTDDLYRTLVDQVLDELKPAIDRRDPGMSYRAGWIFMSSPRAVTPFHIDREHNFILQVAGSKRLYVWDPDDTVAVSEAARDLFHDTHSRELISWSDELKSRARIFDLQPGMGAYMPSTSPHMVENGPRASITASFTYYTDATRRNNLLHKLHSRMRGRGWSPPAVGTHPVRDSLFHGLLTTALLAKRGVMRVSGQSVAQQNPRYAIHRFS
jgi:hypothetical protein